MYLNLESRWGPELPKTRRNEITLPNFLYWKNRRGHTVLSTYEQKGKHLVEARLTIGLEGRSRWGTVIAHEKRQGSNSWYTEKDLQMCMDCGPDIREEWAIEGWYTRIPEPHLWLDRENGTHPFTDDKVVSGISALLTYIGEDGVRVTDRVPNFTSRFDYWHVPTRKRCRASHEWKRDGSRRRYYVATRPMESSTASLV